MGGKDHDTRAEAGFIKRRNKINGQWSPRLIEMLESPAYQALSLSAHRVISRIEIELAHHGGNDNGRLPVTKLDFIEYGISPRLIAPAIREAEALGFVRVTERGRGGNAEYRQPNLFFLTFARGRDSRANLPTDDWRKIKTIEEAETIAKAAREQKNASAVAIGRRRKNRNQVHLVHPVSGAPSVPENRNSPDPLSVPTRSGHLVYPLSISWVGTDSNQRIAPMCWATPNLTDVIDPAERAAIQCYWRPKLADARSSKKFRPESGALQ
jgi:hypothetical protein